MDAQPDRVSGGYTLTIEEPGRIGAGPLDTRDPAPTEVRIATLYSGISAGTEMTAFAGSNPYLNKRWNPTDRVFEASSASWSYPIPAMGYEEVGRVVEVGAAVDRVRVGQVVWGDWGHRSHHVADQAWAADRVLADGVDPKFGIFARIGGIALNAVLDANIHLGEYVAVFGQGVPGLMVTQLARASGATVIAVDRLSSRLEQARASGAYHVIDATRHDPAIRIKEITGGRGADISIEITGAYAALHDAIRSTAYNSRVVVSGFFQGEGVGLRLGEEFHHNRIELVCSQASGVNRSLDHRWNRLRLDRTVMQLIADKRVDFGRLISHSFPASNAQAAFELLRDTPNDALQVVLDFQDA